jgi:4-oxalocrotonate tautomerase family enzyme
MPFIEAHITGGLSCARKWRLIRDIVQVTHEAIGSDPKIINVLIQEHEETNMSVSGRIACDESEIAAGSMG